MVEGALRAVIAEVTNTSAIVIPYLAAATMITESSWPRIALRATKR